MRRPTLRLALTVATLSPASLVLSHDLSFLAAYGVGAEAALRATGHDAGWTSAVQAVIAISAALGFLALARLLALGRTARRIERETGGGVPADWRALARTVFVLWAWLALVTTAWFLVQENLERLSVGESLPGIAPLLSGGPVGPLLIIPVISLAVALIGGLFRWGIATMRDRIAAATAARAYAAPAPARTPTSAELRRSTALSRNLGLRAPPPPLAA